MLAHYATCGKVRHRESINRGNEGPWQCDVCQKRFSRLGNMIRHKEEKHEFSEWVFRCHICLHLFCRADIRDNHICPLRPPTTDGTPPTQPTSAAADSSSAPTFPLLRPQFSIKAPTSAIDFDELRRKYGSGSNFFYDAPVDQGVYCACINFKFWI